MIIIPILQMRTVRNREVKQLAEGLTVSKGWNLNASLSGQEACAPDQRHDPGPGISCHPFSSQ